MAEDVLLKFLSAGLVDVGGDDAKLEKLRASATQLSDALNKNASKTIAYSLIAFDPKAPPEDPVVGEVITVLKEKWPTYVNTFSGTPIAVVRALLLDALVQASSADDRVAIGFASSARNALPFMEADIERAIWLDVLQGAELRVDAKAEAEWATPATISVPPLETKAAAIPAPKLKHAAIDRATLVPIMAAAAGPNYNQGATGGNPHWPQGNQAWVTEFANRMAAAVADMMDTAIAQIAIDAPDISTPMKELTTAVSQYAEGTLKAVSTATAGLQRRTSLIWWKEALYSPSGRVSYRELPGQTAAVLMAYDLHQQIPIFSPASVGAFLQETVKSLPSIVGDKNFDFSSLVRQTRGDPALETFREEVADLVPETAGRGPLLNLIVHPTSDGDLDGAGFRNRTGVPADEKITLPKFALWLFRELQAARSTQEAPTPRRTRKA